MPGADPTPLSAHDASTHFRRAILRRPGRSLTRALSTAGLGAPDVDRALRQHAAYASALTALGLDITVLPADEAHPDSVFIEDAALLAGGLAVLTRPGAASRRGEPDTLKALLRSRFAEVARIAAPGTLDAGDVLRVGDRFFIGRSSRTNDAGAQELAGHLSRHGLAASVVDVPVGLHLKSAVAHLGGGRLLMTEALVPVFAAADGAASATGREAVRTAPGEARAANCLAVNGRVLVPEGCPATRQALEDLGFDTLAVDVSEFEKLDGGLSCLSLRY